MTSRRLSWFDLTFVVGLLLLVGGIAMWSVPAAAVLAGVILCVVSLRAAALADRVPSPSPSPLVTADAADQAPDLA